MTAILLAAVLSQTPDAGTDTPYWQHEDAGTTLQEEMYCGTPETAQTFDVALRTAQLDAKNYKAEIDSGTQGQTVKWALIAGGTGLVLGLVVGGLVGGFAVARKL